MDFNVLKNKIIEGSYFSVGCLVSKYSKIYSGPMEGFVYHYVNDVTAPFALYFYSKLFNFDWAKNQWANAGIIFLGCSVAETMQKLELAPGTFREGDFIAYAAGLGLAITLDNITLKKKINILEKELGL